ncbi:MAG TPA: sigma-70 family RNA polymerase sigma factor [Hyphomicrobiales bacterium]|nr:sigma-70 family RNA polymerase sigma factor [Rhodobiaceae bacterium]HXK53307.1 sigma-70 family RNA polymerase sigma factor [Hyphomicrobiales bacterium]
MAIDRRELADLIPALRRFSRAMVAERAAADDMVQDCLLLALDREAQFRGPALKPWVFAILANLGRARYRALKAAPPMDAFDECADGGGDPALRLTVVMALEGLPAEQRKVLLLVAVEGFSYREVADMLALPVGTVMSRLWRARRLLAERMQAGTPIALRRVK